MEKIRSKKEPEVYYYFDRNNKKKWCFRHRYYDSLGNRREKSGQGFDSENVCIRALLEVKTAIVNGDTRQVENSELTIGEWMDRWYETHQNEWEVTSQMQREMAIRLQIKPMLGKYKLQQLDKTAYKRAFINPLLKNYSPSTVRLLHKLFKIAINAAVDDEILRRNRFNNISIPEPVNKVKENFLPPDQLRHFLLYTKEHENMSNYSLILTLTYTGMRKGEALGLTWEDIDFKNKTISVNRTRDDKGVRTPKTKNSYRTILVDDLLLEQLTVYRSWCKERKFRNGMHMKDDDYVFISSSTSRPLCAITLNYCVTRSSERSGLTKITPHGLRHTHASILIAQRIPVSVIAARLGNTPQMVLSTYAHLFQELEEESVLAFGNIVNL
jgi:integrase